MDKLCKDLIEWETLYCSGRMHKPVRTLSSLRCLPDNTRSLNLYVPLVLFPCSTLCSPFPGYAFSQIRIVKDDPRVKLANQVNLASALRVSLLTLPPTFSERDLYLRLAGLSYSGDPRMSVPGAENPAKVGNIVDSQMERFRGVYGRLLSELDGLAVVGGHGGTLHVHFSTAFSSLKNITDSFVGYRSPWVLTARRLALAPSGTRPKAAQEPQGGHQGRLHDHGKGGDGQGGRGCSVGADWRVGRARHTVGFSYVPLLLSLILTWRQTCLERQTEKTERRKEDTEARLIFFCFADTSRITRRPALTQSLKGIVTTGPLKSLWYSSAKFSKWNAGRRTKVDDQGRKQ